MPIPELRPDKVVALVNGLNGPIRDHQTSEPPNKLLVLETLNALAIVTASVLEGTRQHPQAVGFYRTALQQALDDLAAQDRIALPVDAKPPTTKEN